MDATIRVEDLEATLDYLEGLDLILTRFAEHSTPESVSNDLYVALQGALTHAGSWAPLRYGGQLGWQAVAAGVRNVREHLRDAYPDAAL